MLSPWTWSVMKRPMYNHSFCCIINVIPFLSLLLISLHCPTAASPSHNLKTSPEQRGGVKVLRLTKLSKHWSTISEQKMAICHQFWQMGPSKRPQIFWKWLKLWESCPSGAMQCSEVHLPHQRPPETTAPLLVWRPLELQREIQFVSLLHPSVLFRIGILTNILKTQNSLTCMRFCFRSVFIQSSHKPRSASN